MIPGLPVEQATFPRASFQLVQPQAPAPYQIAPAPTPMQSEAPQQYTPPSIPPSPPLASLFGSREIYVDNSQRQPTPLPTRTPTPTPLPKQKYNIAPKSQVVRAAQVSPVAKTAPMGIDENKELAAVLFGELSNRGSVEDRKKEARIILGTILNRAKESQQSPYDVISTPKQYQAYKSKQYNVYMASQKDYPSLQKARIVDDVISEYTSGNYKDISGGANFYVHDIKTGIIYPKKAKADYPRKYKVDKKK